MAQSVNVGLIGCGTVGAGVAKALLDKPQALARRIGTRVNLSRVCDRDLKRARALNAPVTDDPKSILRDPSIEIVVELIGGIHPAKELILEALKAGKHVVTANKALLAESGHELFAAAQRYGADLYFEASVGGGIPIVKAMREGLIANEIDAIVGIVNGTSNYILSQMRDKQLSFHEALLGAKQHGYAERDPSLDIEGHDAAHKLAILVLLGFGVRVPLSSIYTEGISSVTLLDIQYAEAMGYRLKPLAIAKEEAGKLEVRVHPALISQSHLLANVNGVYNGIYVHGDMVGAELFYGRGAGQNPAASAVLSDIADVARNVAAGTNQRIPLDPGASRAIKLRKMDDIDTRYYLRFSVVDKPGILARIAGILGKFRISIATVHQKERRAAKTVPVIMMTHDAKEANVRKALAVIDRMGVVKSKTIAIRTEAPRGK